MQLAPVSLFKLAIATVLGIFVTTSLFASEAVIGLLQLPTSKIVEASGAPQPPFAALTDGDLRRETRVGAPGQAVEIVFDVGEATMTATEWRVHLTDNKQTLRAELLASTVSDRAGFKLLRSDMLDHRASGKSLEFAPTAARWLLVRFTPANETHPVTAAEISVSGYEGTPKSQYAFNTSPAKALDVLASLRVSKSIDIGLDADEVKLFEDSADAELNDFSFAEASLLSSRVFDRAKRDHYLKQLDELESQARIALGSVKAPFDKGQRLLSWMHRKNGPLSGGYVAQQTDLSVLLDTKTYNCVSSATIYNILGRRLGLDLRAIEVPDHAFSILYDGTKHADVETTTASGFNPARDELGRKEFEERTGFRYIPDSHRGDRREVNEPGLVAITYYNHGVTFTKQKQYNRALLAYFRAMSMDPEFSSAVNNSLAALVNWAAELEEKGNFEESVAVNAIGLQLAPDDAALRHNRSVTYTRWARSLADSDRDDEALAVLRRAAKLMPDDHFVSMQAWQYIRRAEHAIDQNDWTAALDICKSGATEIDEAAREEVEKWQRDFYLRWSNHELRSKRFDHAVALLEKGIAVQPDNGRLIGNLSYAVQEWARDLCQNESQAAAREMLLQQLGRFPNTQGVAEVAQNHARRVFIDLRGQRKFSAAIDSIAVHANLFHDADEPARLYRDGFSNWARHCMSQRKWDEGLRVYQTGLETLPDDSRLTGNLTYFVQEWAKDLLAKEGAEAARSMLLEQRQQLADIKKIDRVAEQFANQLVEASLRAKKFDDALTALDENRELLSDASALRLVHRIFDQEADVHQRQQEWRAAIDVYLAGLKRHPNDKHLTHNAVVFCHQWADGFMKQEDWSGAVKVYEQALKLFPDAGSLKQNLKYCHQQNSRGE